eukprot:GFYU01000708.1.p1 GENE.GFYU01000708.1~~GFYU01000708.1.p1  ORF type:complete len:340 (-),score=77.75 GFYU01000708.1:110-1129(-)
MPSVGLKRWDRWLTKIETPYELSTTREAALEEPTKTLSTGTVGRVSLLKMIERFAARHVGKVVLFYAHWAYRTYLVMMGMDRTFSLLFITLAHIAMLLVWALYQTLYKAFCIRYLWSTLEFKTYELITVEEADTYQNKELLAKARKLPVAQLYPQPLLFQPKEGFCGYTTLNNLLLSAANKADKDKGQERMVKFPPCAQHVTVMQMYFLCRQVHAFKHFPQIVDVQFYVELSYQEYMYHLKLSNDRKYRYMACWLRTPLFFSDSEQRKKDGLLTKVHKAHMAHWSPIGGFLEKENRVLILDVNEKYDEFLVSPERFYDTINCRDFLTGAWRGFIRLEVE